MRQTPNERCSPKYLVWTHLTHLTLQVHERESETPVQVSRPRDMAGKCTVPPLDGSWTLERGQSAELEQAAWQHCVIPWFSCRTGAPQQSGLVFRECVWKPYGATGQRVFHLLSTLEDNNMPKYRELGNDESVDVTDVIIEESGERVYKCSSCHFFHFL